MLTGLQLARKGHCELAAELVKTGGGIHSVMYSSKEMPCLDIPYFDDPHLWADIIWKVPKVTLHHQLPEAIINLKQGAGRLIRDESDRGVLMICDPRMLSKPYGRRIWQSLPPFARTRELTTVHTFLQNLPR